MGRRALKEEKAHITKEQFLELLKMGTALLIAFTAPGALKLFKGSLRETPWEEFYPSSVERTAKKLWRKGYVEIKEEGEQTVVKLTEKGRVEILRYNLENLEIKKPQSWDGRWRLVIFDIPEKEKMKRELFREKLKVLGFFQLQESVFVFPYSCEREIKFLREVLEVPHFVKILRADRIENDAELRQIFRLK